MRRTIAFSSNDFASRVLELPAAALRVVGFALDSLFCMVERFRQREALRAMPDYLLKDVGLSRADVEREAEKPFWKL